MSVKQKSRIRRSAKARKRIKQQGVPRLCVFKTPRHMYAQIIVVRDNGDEVLASASTLDKELRGKLTGNKTEQAKQVGKLVASRAKKKAIDKVAFDRSGFKYHGRVKALAEAAREEGVNF